MARHPNHRPRGGRHVPRQRRTPPPWWAVLAARTLASIVLLVVAHVLGIPLPAAGR